VPSAYELCRGGDASGARSRRPGGDAALPAGGARAQGRRHHLHRGGHRRPARADRAPAAAATAPVLGEEEMGEAEQRRLWDEGAEGLWVVDPIDGTTNFVAGLPFFAISVAYFIGGRAAIGVVYDPATREMFAASRGGGATMNGLKLPLRPPAADLRVRRRRRLQAHPEEAGRRPRHAAALLFPAQLRLQHPRMGLRRRRPPRPAAARRPEAVGLRRRTPDPRRGRRTHVHPQARRLRRRRPVEALGHRRRRPAAVFRLARLDPLEALAAARAGSIGPPLSRSRN
jgi:hypothetical protein